MDVNALPGPTVPESATSLCSIPPEVLCGIVTHLRGKEIAFLWLCGSNALNANLGARGAVKRFEMDLDPICNISWPSILDHLPHVADFRILDDVYTRDTLRFPHLSFGESSALRSLTLQYAGSSTAFLRALDRTPSAFSTLETLNIVGEQKRLTEDNAVALRSMETLKSLRLGFSSYSDGPLSDLIPPNVTYLYLKLASCDTVDFKLPDSLVTYKMLIGGFYDAHDAETFPPGLTKFCFKNTTKVFTVEEISRLPSTLTHLNVTVDLEAENLWTSLPPSLRAFKMPEDSPETTDAHFKLYPRSITHLNSNPLITTENIEFLPSSLTTLSNVSPDLHLLSKLPPNLTNLKFYCTVEQIDDSTSLDRIALPKCLTQLTGLSATLLARCNLPSTLTFLNVVSGIFTSDNTRALPAGLRELEHSNDFESDCLAGLPRRLTRLSVGTIISQRARSVITAELAANLPSTLTSLDLFSIELDSADTIASLPRSIKHLYLQLENLSNCSDLSQLPKTLKTLTIHSENYQDGLGRLILTSLPRKLISFNLTTGATAPADIDRGSLEQLPPGLTFLNIPDSTQLGDLGDPYMYLPPYLNAIHCGMPIWERE